MQINLELRPLCEPCISLFIYLYDGLRVYSMYSWLCPWLLTWPDLKEKDQEGRTLRRLCELSSFSTVSFACAVEA
jgi:hypothetical protein